MTTGFKPLKEKILTWYTFWNFHSHGPKSFSERLSHDTECTFANIFLNMNFVPRKFPARWFFIFGRGRDISVYGERWRVWCRELTLSWSSSVSFRNSWRRHLLSMEVLVLRLGGHRKARYFDTVNVLWRIGNQGNSEEYYISREPWKRGCNWYALEWKSSK